MRVRFPVIAGVAAILAIGLSGCARSTTALAPIPAPSAAVTSPVPPLAPPSMPAASAMAGEAGAGEMSSMGAQMDTAVPTAGASQSAAPLPTGIPSTLPPGAVPSGAPASGVTVRIPATQGGLAPVIHQVDTTDPVVFITIDDGYYKSPAVAEFLAANKIPVTPFLAMNAITSDPHYFNVIQGVTGQVPQDHSMTHPFLSKLSYSQQKAQICQAADEELRYYGTRPWLFRPPFGDFNADTQRAAAACGMRALVMWDASLPHAIVRFAAGDHFRAGDILLVHWRPNMARDIAGAVAQIKAQGLRVAALQDYLPIP